MLIYDLQSKDWRNTYYMLKGFLKACRPPIVSNEMKYTNKKMTWNIQDTNLSSYVPKANVDHTISEQGTAISALNHSATTPRVFVYALLLQSMSCWTVQALLWDNILLQRTISLTFFYIVWLPNIVPSSSAFPVCGQGTVHSGYLWGSIWQTKARHLIEQRLIERNLYANFFLK